MSGNPEHRQLDIQPVIAAMNLIMQQFATNRGVRVSKTKYFFPAQSEGHRLSLGVEAHRGFFMSVRPTFKQLMVNANVCMTAFYTSGNLGDAMLAFLRETGGAMPQTFADKLKVSTTHRGYTKKYKIFRIMTSKTARSEKFDCAEPGPQVSVENFFKWSASLKFHFFDF